MLFVSFWLSLRADAQAQTSSGDQLRPQKPVAFRVMPPGDALFVLELPAGDYVQICVEQLEGRAEVTVESAGGKTGAVRFRDTGKHGIIRYSLIAAADQTYEIRIRSYHRDAAVAGTITVSEARSASEQDHQGLQAEALLAEAEWSRRKGDRATWEQAQKNYDQAAALAESLQDRSLLRDVLTGKARLLIFRLNDYHAARAVASRAVGIEGDDDLPAQALAWKTLSSAEYYVADYPESIKSARRALDLYQQTDDAYWQGISLGNLAYMYREIGETQEALKAAQLALDLARSQNDWFGVAFNQEAMATIHLARGELEQAFEYYHQALDTMREHPYPQEEAAAWNGLGELALETDDLDGAEVAFHNALETAMKANDTAGSLKVLSNLGNLALERRQPKEAIRFYQQGLERARSLQLPREESFLLAGLGTAHAAQRETKDALANYREAIAVAGKISQKDSEASALQKLGDLYFATGQAEPASEAYQQAYDLWTQQSDRAHSATALASLARVESSQGELERAEQDIEKSLDLIEAERRTLASRELRTSYFASKHAYYDLGISILMRLNRSFPERGNVRKAFELAERARARTLLDSLNGANATTLFVPALAEQRQRNQARLNAAYERWRELTGDSKAPPQSFEELRKEIERLLREGDEIDARARASNESYAVLTGRQPASLAEVQKQILGPRSALLSYWVGERESYAWLVRPNSVSVERLPGRGVLEPAVRALRESITARQRFPVGEGIEQRAARLQRTDRQAEQSAHELGGILLPGVLQKLNLRTLFVVADGPLFGVPFAALKSADSAEYVVAKMAVLEEPSASTLLWLSSSKTQSEGKSRALAIFGDPVYTADDVRLADKNHAPEAARVRNATLRWAAESSVAHLPRLLGSRAEALKIAGLDKSGHAALYMDFDASAETVRKLDWQEYRIAHFAVHALLNSDHPAFSGMILSMFRSDGSPQNGLLRLPDIYALHMPIDLLVLSGCRTSEGRLVPGEGLVSLARAFLVAGARGVVGSLWGVEDQHTSQLMREFYANLLVHGMAPPEALRRAQLSIARSPEMRAPYYWAGFAFQGWAKEN